MSLLAAFLNQADYPLYRVDVVLTTNQQFSYVMIFNSGLPPAYQRRALIAFDVMMPAFRR